MGTAEWICSFRILIRVAERFFSGVPQPPPHWRLLPESFFSDSTTLQQQPPHRPNQPILRLVVFGEGIEVIESGAG